MLIGMGEAFIRTTKMKTQSRCVEIEGIIESLRYAVANSLFC